MEATQSQGDADAAGMRMQLDAMTVHYYRHVFDRLIKGFTEDEERDVWVKNVLSEVKKEANLVAVDEVGSLVLEKLLSLATAVQVGEVLAELGGDTGSKFSGVVFNSCGCHVMARALRQTHKWMEESGSADVTQTEEEEDFEILEAQVLRLSGVIRENITKFIKCPYGSHVLRKLLHVLAGWMTPEAPGAQHVLKKIPASFWWELKYLSDTLMENIDVCFMNHNAIGTLQTLLTVCHRTRPILCKKLNKSIMGYLTSLISAPGVSPLLQFLKSAFCSRLMETFFTFAHKALLRDIYTNHLKEQLVSLALHPFANYTVQTLISVSSGLRLFLKIFDELVEGIEGVLAKGHMGVVVQLAESCVQCEERQDTLMQCLLKAFHCSDPASRQTKCLPLFASLLAYEVYYQTETAGDATVTQRPLPMYFNGSRLVKALARFRDRSILMNSLHALSLADLMSLQMDPSTTHALGMSASHKE